MPEAEAESSQSAVKAPGPKRSRKCLKICCCTTLALLIVFIVVAITLYFTILKPKQPQFVAHPTSLKNIDVQILPSFSLNLTIGVVITINNRNYGSFKFENSTMYVDYHGTNIAEVLTGAGNVPARRKSNLTADIDIDASKLVTNSHFLSDLAAGTFNLTSMGTLQGKATALKIFKIKATVVTTCDISIFIFSKSQESNCNSKIKT